LPQMTALCAPISAGFALNAAHVALITAEVPQITADFALIAAHSPLNIARRHPESQPSIS
jgi:hypothetical protein